MNATDTPPHPLEQLRDALAGHDVKADLAPDRDRLTVTNPSDDALSGVVVCNGDTFEWKTGGVITSVTDLDTAVQRITWVLASPVGTDTEDRS